MKDGRKKGRDGRRRAKKGKEKREENRQDRKGSIVSSVPSKDRKKECRHAIKACKCKCVADQHTVREGTSCVTQSVPIWECCSPWPMARKKAIEADW